MAIKDIIKKAVGLVESQHAISDNQGYGYHGAVDPEVHKSKKKPVAGATKPNESDERDKHFRKMHAQVRQLTGTDAKTAKHYLDSVHGRHLGDVHNDNVRRGLAAAHVHNYIKKDFASFKKHYKPELFEELKDQLTESVVDSSDKAKLIAHASSKQILSQRYHVVKQADKKYRVDPEDQHQKRKQSGDKILHTYHGGQRYDHNDPKQGWVKEEVELQEATYTPKSYDKKNDHPSKSKNTFILGVHGDEAEHIESIKHAAGKSISHEKAKAVAHSSEYHEHAYKWRHDFSRGGSNGYDNGVKHLAGTHPHPMKEEVDLNEWPTDSGSSFKTGDKVIVKNPSSPHHNKRGTYSGMERGRHVVKHADGSRSVHGSGVLLKEDMKSADKVSVVYKTPEGKYKVRKETRNRSVARAGAAINEEIIDEAYNYTHAKLVADLDSKKAKDGRKHLKDAEFHFNQASKYEPSTAWHALHMMHHHKSMAAIHLNAANPSRMLQHQKKMDDWAAKAKNRVKKNLGEESNIKAIGLMTEASMWLSMHPVQEVRASVEILEGALDELCEGYVEDAYAKYNDTIKTIVEAIGETNADALRTALFKKEK